MPEKKHKLILLGLIVSLLLPISLLIYTYAFTESWVYDMGWNTMKIAEVPVAITPDGSFIVAGNNDGKVGVFHKSSSTPLWIDTEVGRVESVAISSNGDYIAAVSRFPGYLNKLYLFSKLNSTPLWEFSFSGGDSYSQVVMSSDGNYIVIASTELHFFHKFSSTPLWSATTYGAITSVDMSSDGNFILAGSKYNELVYFFNSSSPIPLWNYTSTDDIYSIALSSNGKFAAVGTDELLLFNTSDLLPNVPLWKYEINMSETASTKMEVDISSNGNYIAASSTVHNPITSQNDINVYFFDNLNSTPKAPLWTDTKRTDSIRDISITPLGDFIFVVGRESLYLYAKTGSKPIFQKKPRVPISQSLLSGAISADGTYFVVGGLSTLWFFNRNNPALIEELLWLAIFSYLMLATSSIGIIITYSIMKKRISI
ncbi:MAG: hypothetical protein KGD61_09175 [Candidatus Lokiarchaeota archaeon]|nr:hypothetical protein [Candidatus Lokiarchaeota archaeon]